MYAFTIALGLLAIIFGGWLYIGRGENLLGLVCCFAGVCGLAGAFVVWFVDMMVAAL